MKRAGSLTLIALMAACNRDGVQPATEASADVRPAAPLSYWSGLSTADVAQYPAPTMVSTVARAADIPRVMLARNGGKPIGSASNKAVEISVLASGMQPAIFGNHAPAGSTFAVLDTRWRNIHAKQRIDKASSQGAADRTMGVGGFASGQGRGGSAADSVDMDVAYLIPKLSDHVYLVADGLAKSLHAVTEEIPGGAKINDAFSIAKLGQTRDARLAFIVPGNAKNVALQFFDYDYGNIVIPIRGNAKKAVGDGSVPGDVIDKAQTSKVDFAVHSLTYAPSYDGTPAQEGWRYAIVGLGGRSKSTTGNLGNIVQIDPLKFVWLEGNGGYVYPAVGGSTSNGVLRFTPEIYQLQEVAFQVPANADRFRIGVRAENEVARMNVTDSKPDGLPRAKSSWKDGNTMEVMLFGTRQEGDHIIADLAVRPLGTSGQGIEMQPDQQFLLVTSSGEVQADMPATWTRVNRPPQPFTVPPGAPVRFELSFPIRGNASAIRVRGFEGEGKLEL